MRVSPTLRLATAGLLILAGGLIGARPSAAQSLALGPRMAFVRGDLALDPASTTYTGGQLRLFTGLRTALELSLDYRTELDEDATRRVRQYPLQGSLLLFPVRGPLAPYLLGGIGWYTQRVDTLEADRIVATEKERAFGYHAGVGGELRFHRRLGAFLDYRYTFLGFGEPEADEQAGAVPIPGTRGLQRQLRLTHRGSMWTSGLAVYF